MRELVHMKRTLALDEIPDENPRRGALLSQYPDTLLDQHCQACLDDCSESFVQRSSYAPKSPALMDRNRLTSV